MLQEEKKRLEKVAHRKICRHGRHCRRCRRCRIGIVIVIVIIIVITHHITPRGRARSETGCEHSFVKEMYVIYVIYVI